MSGTRKIKHIFSLLLLLLLATGSACRLTSPTPASWGKTPTAQTRAITSTALVKTQQAGAGEENLITPTEPPPESSSIPTTHPSIIPDGPWLVYPAPDQKGLHAYDVETGDILRISLPEPIFTADISQGLSPDGHTLIIRSGSPLNTDELALYQIDLPSTEVIKLTPLLSLSLQREIAGEESSRASETLQAVTRPDGIAWSPDGRFLAFTAALDGNSSDLYVFDTERGRIDRLNGLYSHSATPFWAPESNWVILQELDYAEEGGWQSEVISAISMPGYVYHRSLYIPPNGSREEVFQGWINAQGFVSYSRTEDGASTLRQVNVEKISVSVIFQSSFKHAAFAPESNILAIILDEEDALTESLMEGIYLRNLGSASTDLLRAGIWDGVAWDDGGMFIATGKTGVFAFSPEGESVSLPNETDLSISPNGSWMVAWGEGEGTASGARLFQSPNGNPLQQLTDAWVETVYWAPDSKNFFMQAENTLYHLTFPGLSLKEVEGGFPANMQVVFVWVE